MRALRTRLNIGLGVILSIGFGIQWGFRNYIIPVIAEEQMLTRLNHDIDALQTSIRFDRKGDLVVDLAKQLPVYRQAYSGHYFLIESGIASLKSPSMGDAKVVIPRLSPGEEHKNHVMGPVEQPLLVLSRGITIQGFPVSLSVGEDLSALDHDVSKAGTLFLLLNGITIGLALIVQWLFVRRALKPFMMLSRELNSLGMVKDRRVSATELPDSDEVKRLIDLVHRRLQRSRNAIGNMSHAIKTPLSLLLRLAEDPALAGHGHIGNDIKQYAGTIHRLVDSELRRARLAGTSHVVQNFNPYEVMPGLLKVLRAMYIEKPLEFSVQAINQEVPFDYQDFMELAGNLLDNAAKWATLKVEVHIDLINGGLRVQVEDDGVGCSKEMMESLTRRGVRVDETKEGHGLGLSIVKDLVTQYNGTLELDRSERLGGLKVTAVLGSPV